MKPNQAPSRAPSGIGTLLLLVLLIVGAVIGQRGPEIPQQLVYLSSSVAGHPWSLFTFPFVDIDTLHAMLSIILLAAVGREAEKRLGTGRVLAIWLLAGILFAGGSTLAFGMNHFPGIASGASVPVCAVLVAWLATRTEGKGAVWIAIGAVTIALAAYHGHAMPSLGLAAAIPLAVAAALGKRWAS